MNTGFFIVDPVKNGRMTELGIEIADEKAKQANHVESSKKTTKKVLKNTSEGDTDSSKSKPYVPPAGPSSK